MWSSTLDSLTWDQIDEIAQSGFADGCFSIGDEKNITVNNEQITLQIYGFGLDNLVSGGKAAITFGTKNLMSQEWWMKNYVGNDGGFKTTGVYDRLVSNIENNISSDLLSVMKRVYKKTAKGSFDAAMANEDLLTFIFASSEVFNVASDTENYNDEGPHYPIFSSDKSRIKTRNGSPDYWWLRSPSKTSLGNAYGSVSPSGTFYSMSSTTNCGICWGFCI